MVVDNEDEDCQMTFAIMTPCFTLESNFLNHYSFPNQLYVHKMVNISTEALAEFALHFQCDGLYSSFGATCFQNLSLCFLFCLLVWPNLFQRTCTRSLGGWWSISDTTVDTSKVREWGEELLSIGAGYTKTLYAVRPFWRSCLSCSLFFPSLFLSPF